MQDHSLKEDSLKRMALSEMKLGQCNRTEPFSLPTLMAVKYIHPLLHNLQGLHCLFLTQQV